MSKLTKSWLDKKDLQFDSSMLKVGEMMECTDDKYPERLGEIITKVANLSTMSLNDMKHWNATSKVIGRKLQPGESITLTQE